MVAENLRETGDPRAAISPQGFRPMRRFIKRFPWHGPPVPAPILSLSKDAGAQPSETRGNPISSLLPSLFPGGHDDAQNTWLARLRRIVLRLAGGRASFVCDLRSDQGELRRRHGEGIRVGQSARLAAYPIHRSRWQDRDVVFRGGLSSAARLARMEGGRLSCRRQGRGRLSPDEGRLTRRPAYERQNRRRQEGLLQPRLRRRHRQRPRPVLNEPLSP